MLIAFLRGVNDDGCVCKIDSFCDRLWVETEEGSDVTYVLRSVLFSVEQGTLTSLDMVVPFELERVQEPQNVGEHAYDPCFVFNESFVSEEPFVVHHGPDLNKGMAPTAFAEVDKDGYQHIKIYPYAGVRLLGCGQCSFLSIEFQHGIPAGDRVEALIQFEVQALLKDVATDDGYPEYEMGLDYLSTVGHESDLELIKAKEREILVSTGQEPPKRYGGFDVILYVPPGFKVTDYDGGRILKDQYRIDGSIGPYVQKVLWHAREKYGEQELISSGEGLRLKPYLSPADHSMALQIRDIKTKISSLDNRLGTVEGDVKTSKTRDIVAIVIAAIGVLGAGISIWLSLAYIH